MSQTKAQLIDPVDGSLVNADINASAAIAGTKISPDFGSQAVATTGALSCFAATISGDNQDSLNFTGTSTNSNRGIAFNSKTALSHSNDSALRINNNAEFDSVNIFAVDNASSAFTLKQGSNEYVTVDTTNSSELITFGNTTTNPKTAILGGNVGIGTSSPSRKLDVVGDAEFIHDNGITIEATSTSANGQLTIIGVNANDQVSAITRIKSISTGSSTAATATAFENRNSSNAMNEHMRITSTGKVGIGTTSPATPLHIKSDTPYIRFEDDNDNQDWTIEARAFFGIHDVTDNAFRLVIDGDGEVGIGTTTPSHLLHAQNASATTTKICVESTGTDSYPAFRVTNDARSYDLGINGASDSFRIFDVTGNTQRVTLDTTGRLAINGDGTKGMLEVRASGGAADQLTALFGANEGTTSGTLSNNADKACRIGIQHYQTAEEPFSFLVASAGSSSSSLSFGGSTSLMNAATLIRFYTAADTTTVTGTERFRINSDGNAAIGATSTFSFNGVGQNHRLIVAGSTTDTDITDNSGAAITISNTDGTANNTAGLHFAREDTDGSPHYDGASIVAQFKETMNTGQYPKADLAFLTSTANNNAPSEKMRLLAAGGLTFGGETTAAHALDDYEEASWTPTVHQGIDGGATYVIQRGWAVKIGSFVHYSFFLRFNGTGNGNHFKVAGLPFTSANNPYSAAYSSGGSLSYSNANFNNSNTQQMFMGNASTVLEFYNNHSGTTSISGSANNQEIYGFGMYRTDT